MEMHSRLLLMSSSSKETSKTLTILQNLKERLCDVASRDRHYLHTRYQKLIELRRKLKDSEQFNQKLALFNEKVLNSLEAVVKRRDAIPAIEFPDNLPISEKREEIAELINQYQVVIIAGETGSGKTTQLPKICLSLGRGARGLIGHTQPRRIAARSVASRISEELNCKLGELVGYQVRFTDQTSDNTAIKLMTDGILLAEIQQDRYLSRYDTIIIDEAHERSLNIDFLLGYLKQLLPKRPDLKIIITSATIDLEKFSQHFNDAPIIEVSGRTYSVEVLYRPLLETENDSQIDAIVSAVQEITSLNNEGDVLVFLSGERDIRETALRLRRESSGLLSSAHLSVVPLYARLSIAEQNKIFQSHRGRRIVLSTNVAETSLTVPGIRYVIDPGYARISRYSFRTKVQRLPIEAISQASANQRKGRCGRVSEGVCIRLYSEEDFSNRPEFTDPEILRTNLAAVILQMAQLRLGDIKHFPFVDMPDHRLINDGHKLLQELHATNVNQHLTPTGRRLSQLPVDPRLGRMLVEANKENCLLEMLIIVSAMSIQDPRERPADKRQAADQKRRDLHKQVTLAVKQAGLNIKKQNESASYSAIHKALLSGLLGNLGQLSKEKMDNKNVGEYQGARNRRFSLFPGSSQFKKKPTWVAAGELIETSKLYAHTVAKIDIDWVLSLAEHLVKRNHLEPHYDAKNGQVMAYEKITLYGLVLIEKKAVSYGKIDSVVSREIFLRSALVEGRYAEHKRIKNSLKQQSPETHFYSNQQQLLKELHELEAKSRRRDILVDDEELFRFYDERVPADVINLEGFERWRKTIEKQQPHLLYIERERLMQRSDAHITISDFPNYIECDGLRVPISYHFDPVHQDDGVTITVPMNVLHLLSVERLDWLVPGLLSEKLTAMIKALPKQWRKQFAPVPSTVEKILPQLLELYILLSKKEKSQQPIKFLAEYLSEQLHRYKGVIVPEDCWNNIELDLYYSMNIHVVDDKGRIIDQGRDLLLLRERYRDHLQDHLQVAGNDFEQQGLSAWTFGDLPETYTLKQGSLNITAYPGLMDCQDSVNLILYDNPTQALSNSLRGQVRLAILSQSQTLKYLRKHLLKNKDLGLSLVDMGSRDHVIDDIICASVRQTCFEEANFASASSTEPNISELRIARQQSDFTYLVEVARSEWVARAEQIAQLLISTLSQVNSIKKQAKKFKNPLVLTYAMADIQQQLSYLFYPGCLYTTPLKWLQQYPRYLKAIAQRLEKVAMDVNHDRTSISEIESLWNRYQDRLSTDNEGHVHLNKELQEYRWMIEELRVSLFAQSLGTLIPVSVKRLNKQWEKC